MSAFSPDKVKSKIYEILAASHAGEDVYVRVGPNRYGMFIWDEEALKHEHFSAAWVSKSLGVDRVELPEVALSWKDVA